MDRQRKKQIAYLCLALAGIAVLAYLKHLSLTSTAMLTLKLTLVVAATLIATGIIAGEPRQLFDHRLKRGRIFLSTLAVAGVSLLGIFTAGKIDPVFWWGGLAFLSVALGVIFFRYFFRGIV